MQKKISVIEPSINIIGAGQLGRTLARLFHTCRVGKIQAVLNRTLSSGKEAIAFIGGGYALSSLSELPLADITFITTPDDTIENLCLQLVKSKGIKPKSIIVHCSGCLSSKILSAALSVPAFIASVHPLYSFATVGNSMTAFKGSYCAIEGDDEAAAMLSSLFKKIGGIPLAVNTDKKAMYHAGSVFASNYLVTLYAQSTQCLQDAGINQKLAEDITISLMEKTLANLKFLGNPKKALTGPLKRGDKMTIGKHVNALSEPQQKILYKVLGLSTLELTQHTNEAKESIEKLLS